MVLAVLFLVTSDLGYRVMGVLGHRGIYRDNGKENENYCIIIRAGWADPQSAREATPSPFDLVRKTVREPAF